MQAEHFEMAQRAQFAEGAPDHGVAFDLAKYAQNGSAITINAALDFAWCRTQLLVGLEARWPFVDEQWHRPALLWQVSLAWVFNRGIMTPDSRWIRYGKAMESYLLRGVGPGGLGGGDKIQYPGEPGWALDPEAVVNGVSTWAALMEFWSYEFGLAVLRQKTEPCGLFLDNAHDAIAAKWMTMGYTGAAFGRKRAAFLAGRTWLMRELRRRWGGSMILVANHAKSQTPWPDYLDELDGLTVEGNPTSLTQRAMLIRHHLGLAKHNLLHPSERRRNFSCSWNEKARPLTWVAVGAHWAERSAGGA